MCHSVQSGIRALIVQYKRILHTVIVDRVLFCVYFYPQKHDFFPSAVKLAHTTNSATKKFITLSGIWKV